MARQTKSTSGNSKIRFIMLEADMDSGDLSEITAAIQNALKPKAQIEQRIVYVEDKHFDSDSLKNDSDAAEFTEVDEGLVAPDRPRRSATKRSYPTPQVVDVDWATDPTIEQFAASHPASTTNDKYLVVLAWFKDVHEQHAVSTNDVYTAFRKLEWPTNIKDFSQPLRDLKSQQIVTGSSKDGFQINHLGLDRVKKLGDAK